MSIFNKLHSYFSPRAKTSASDAPKAMNPTILRVGIDGDDDMRIVFIIEDEASGQQFAHVSLDIDGALDVYQAIEGLADEICGREEAALQKGERDATAEFQAHCDRLAIQDAKLVAQDDAYMQLARDADKRLMAKLAAQATMYGGGYDVSKGAAMAPSAEHDDGFAPMAMTTPRLVATSEHGAANPELDAKRAEFKATMARLVADVQREQEAEHGPVAHGDDAGMPLERPGKPAEADKR